MLATFVIGLREGLEASLIVGIIAAFLKSNGTRRDLRRMWLGVGIAVLLCIGVGLGLEFLTEGLPQREQEMLECVIALVAVTMVTFMIFWMRAHSRDMRGELESAASGALARGSTYALVAMAFLAVMREGFETAVFLLAAFQNASNGATPLVGALLGIAIALVIGWFIYRGALRFNMAKFFTVTAVFLVLVAAGLVLKTFRAAHEAGWLNIGQTAVPGLENLVTKGSIADAIAGGVFGIQSNLVLIEVAVYLLYALPMLAVVLWPKRHLPTPRALRRGLGIASAACAVVAVLGLALAPSPKRGEARDVVMTSTSADALTGSNTTGDDVPLRVGVSDADLSDATLLVDGEARSVPFSGHGDLGDEYVLSETTPDADTADAETAALATLTGEQIAAIRGRYPVGITEADRDTEFPATYAHKSATHLVIDDASHAVLDLAFTDATLATVTLPTGNTVAVGAVSTDTRTLDDASRAAGADAAAAYADDEQRSELVGAVVPLLAGLMALLLGGFALALTRRIRADSPAAAVGPESTTDTTSTPLEKESV